MRSRLQRHAVAVGVLPFTVAVLVPWWIGVRNGIVLTLGGTPARWVVQGGGLVLLVAGVVLFAASLRRFATEGEGTLAPWDPPRHLVVVGPYRYVRNPMISGVVLVLLGEAGVLVSAPHLVWAGFVLGLNLVYIPLIEERMLRRRFGAGYDEYCRHVPRMFPRLRPWEPGAQPRD